MEPIFLGDEVRDRISGLRGIAIARTEWLYGCVRILIQPKDIHEGKPVEPSTIDEPQLELVQRHALVVQPVAAAPLTPRAVEEVAIARHGARDDTAAQRR